MKGLSVDMTRLVLTQITVAACLLAFAGCGKKEEAPPVQGSAATPGAAPAQQSVASSTPAATAPASTPAPGTPASPAGEAATTPSPQAEQAAAPAPPPPPRSWTIPAGTTISVRTLDGMSTKNAKSGNEFDATLTSALVIDGHTLAKAGSAAVGRVTGSDQGGKVKGKATMTVALSRIRLSDGQTINVQTNAVSQEAKSGTKKNVARTGIMAGAGAAIGAIAGGGKGAAIGAGIGGGAGVATNMATRGPAAEIPAEAQLTFQLATSVTVTEKQKK